MAKALKGDTRASNVLIQLALGLEQSEANKPDNSWLAEEDLAILEEFKRRLTTTDPVPPERSETHDADPS
jgi:hypothetical protein